jgi:hypothetical protein
MEVVHTPMQDVLVLAPSQQLKASVIPGSEHQGSEDELSVVRKIDAEGPRSHEPPERILSAFPFLARLYRCIIVRYFLLRIQKAR